MEEKILIYTCGLCQVRCAHADITSHQCVQGYYDIITTDKRHFYPRSKDGTITWCRYKQEEVQLQDEVDDSALLVTGGEIPEVPQNNFFTSGSWKTNKIRIEKIIINEVRKRPPLWNFKLPLAERSLRIKDRLWQEILEKLDGSMSMPELKRKWKSLSDSFRSHMKKSKLPSGTAGGNKKQWIHFADMKFMMDVNLETQTIATNIDSKDVEELNEEGLLDSPRRTPSRTSSDASERKRRYMEEESLLEIAEALVQPIRFDQPLEVNVNVSRPAADGSQTQMDDYVSHFCRYMESQLRNIPDKDVRDAKIFQIMKVLHEH